MRRSLAAVAMLALALAPGTRAADRTGAEVAPPDAAPVRVTSTAAVVEAEAPPDLTPEAARAQADAADADARAAAAAAMPVPEASQRAGVQAKSVLARFTGLRPGLPMVGLAVAGGFPDLGTVSLLVRPVPSIRFFGGPTWGYVGWGLHGGVVFAPWSWWVSPTFSLEAGRLFRSDLSRFLKDGDAQKGALRSIVKGVDYEYAAADVGLELGNPSGFAFTVGMGLSWVTVKANGSATYTTDSGTRVTLTDPVVRATLPSFKTGFQYWF